MQNYSMNRPNKKKIFFILAVISLSVTKFINYFLASVADYLDSGLPFTVMASAVYVGLWLLYDNILWNKSFFFLISQTPDLNGEWLCNGVGLKQNDDSVRNIWSAKIRIEQSYSNMLIFLKTDKSQSVSCGASNEKIGQHSYILSYPYKNSLLKADSDMLAHDGFCQLIFDTKQQTASGYYYTNNARKSYGSMELSRK